MPELPTISVVIAAYRNAAYIGRALESVFAQTRPASEVIVINDGSPEDLRPALAPFMGRIQYVEQDNVGFVRAMNRGTDMATGDYLLQFSSDDWLEPDAFEVLAGNLDRHPKVGLAYGNIAYVDREGRPLAGERWMPFPVGEHYQVERLIAVDYIPAVAVLQRRRALEDAGRHLPDYDYFHDWGLWLSIALCGWRMHGVARVLTNYRRHPDSVTARVGRITLLKNRLAVAAAIEKKYRSTSKPSVRRSFGKLRRKLSRKLALALLETGDRREARLKLSALVTREGDPRAALELAATWLPTVAVQLMGRVDRRLSRSPGSLAARFKDFL